MKEFIISNYTLILSIVLVAFATIIGYLVDRYRIKNEKKESDNNSVKVVSDSYQQVANLNNQQFVNSSQFYTNDLQQLNVAKNQNVYSNSYQTMNNSSNNVKKSIQFGVSNNQNVYNSGLQSVNYNQNSINNLSQFYNSNNDK